MPRICTRPFGNTGVRVTAVGLGGEGVLRTFGREDEAEKVISAAVDQGIAYFDCARVYAGSEAYYGAYWAGHMARRDGVFQASKSASRDRRGAELDLERTLKTMNLDYLDLWQIHDLRTMEDYEAIARPSGALEAFFEAKRASKVKFIGVTGHHDPVILARAIREWPVDAVMMPVNPQLAYYRGTLA